MTEFASSLPSDAPENPFDRLCWIMDQLLGPGGCPWDREQTHATIKQYLIEEAYEVFEAIEKEDFEHLKEELGDVALQVVFHAALARRAGKFDVEAALEHVCEKLVRRHPHVFGQTVAENPAAVLEHWEQIKKRERAAKKGDESLVSGIPRSLPALQKAHRIQEKVSRVGFDWPDVAGTLEKAREEFEELAGAAMETGSANEALADGGLADATFGCRPSAKMIEEMGDLLFSLVNVSRRLGIQPEEALQSACGKFTERFRHIERRAREKGARLDKMTLEEMDALWEEAKENET